MMILASVWIKGRSPFGVSEKKVRAFQEKEDSAGNTVYLERKICMNGQVRLMSNGLNSNDRRPGDATSPLVMISESKGWFGQGAHQRTEKAAIIAPTENKSVLVDKIIENNTYHIELRV